MRFFVLYILMLFFAIEGHAQRKGDACVDPRTIRSMVEQKQVIEPAKAVIAARKAIPDGDVLRANLCQNEAGLVYIIVILRKDGKVVQVPIDGPSGKVGNIN